MFDEPDDLTPHQVRTILSETWGFDAARVTYAPVGFGSYHWIAERAAGERTWFVTADRLDRAEQRSSDVLATLVGTATATAELARRGYEFVLAGLTDRTGRLVVPVDGRWAMQTFPYVTGTTSDFGTWSDAAERGQVAMMLARLHAAELPSSLPRWDPAIPSRASLEHALADADRPWTSGPYAERTRALLLERQDAIRRRFARYDELAAAVVASDRPWVVSHGEPHAGNVITTGGRTYLIDWDTVRLAPVERDLVNAFDDGHSDLHTLDALTAYQTVAGSVELRTEAVELFRAWWSLAEICAYTRHLRRPHGDGADDRQSWQNLRGYVPDS